ncbi:MAG: ATP-binding protein [Thermodesulfobacteriota bacterium]
MNTKSLRTIIAVNLAVLILAATVLFDFVVLSTDRQQFIAARVREHHLLSLAVSSHLTWAENGPLLAPGAEPALHAIFQAAQVDAVTLLNGAGNFVYVTGMKNPAQVRLVELADRSMLEAKTLTDYYGTTWGVFLIRSRYLLIASPLAAADGKVGGSLGTVVDMDRLYSAQRRTQSLLFGYALFNLIVLTLIGTFLISRFSVNPIDRLVRRAEEYKDTDDLGFLYAKDKNEFRQLSGALNRMLKRITADKHRLQSSLDGLEKANIEIQNRQNELIRAEKLASVGRLAAGIAHEIGNPIGIVLGYLGMLNNPSLSKEERQDYIQRCESEINRINATIRELLDFSRPAGEKPCPVALSGIISETIHMLRVQPGMKDIVFSCDFTTGDDTVTAPPDRLRQVFVNLIINAADALSFLPAEKKKTIAVTTRAVTSHTGDKPVFVEATVIDNGTGIAEKNIDLIFDPFYTTKEPGKGTGLGLSVCFMIIQSLGGTIRAESREGHGTAIILKLPAADKRKDR